MKVVGIIPVRMGSSRFPGKPLAPISGKTMIEHVFKRSALCRSLDVIVGAIEAYPEGCQDIVVLVKKA